MTTSSLYDEYYYSHNCGSPYKRDQGWLNFFDQIAGRLIEQSEPKTVLDAGCAWGFLVEGFRNRGVDAFGVDISEYAIQNVCPDIKPYCWAGSITEPFPSKYDLITCIEVLEHMPQSEAEKAIENLCAHTDEIIFSSTPFDYKEATHFNVHDPEYWAEQFARHSFYRDVDADMSYITAWAVRFIKTKRTNLKLVQDYERKFWQYKKENFDLRQLSLELQNSLKYEGAQNWTLNSQVEEKEQAVQALNAKLSEIHGSRAWRLIQWLWRIRLRLIPHGSRVEQFAMGVKKNSPTLQRPTKKVEQDEPDLKRQLESKTQEYDGQEIFSTHIDDVQSKKGINILFISGEPDTPGHVYRVERYIETYRALGISANWKKSGEIIDNLSVLDTIQLLIFWRTFYDANIELIINYAKRKEIKTVFDADDLVFDVSIVDSHIIDAIRFQKLDIERVKRYYQGMLKTLLQVDICTCTTEALSDAMGRFGKETFVLPNGYDYEQFEKAITHIRKNNGKNDGVIRIGYAGGTRTHQKDFKQALPAILKIIEEFHNVIITVFGEALDINEFPEVQGYENRFETRKMVPLRDLIDEIARFDINIAPLEVNQFCEAKSELKYFEAALVKVPTVASPTRSFENAIQNGINGFLAYDDSDWYRYLKLLIESESLRNIISKQAFQHVLWHFGPEQRTYLVYNFLEKNKLSHHVNFPELREKVFSFQKKLAPFSKINRYSVPNYAKFDKLFEHKTGTTSKIGVVIPLYNYEEFILETLESILNQSLAELDLVIVNDCSTDKSLDAAIDWLSKYRDRFANCAVLHNVENQGLSASRNIGFDYLQNLWVMPVDADNILLPNCLEECAKVIFKNNFSCVYTKLELFGEDKDYIQSIYGGMELNTAEWDPMRLISTNYIDAMALISRAAWENVGGYDISLKHGLEDYDLWLKFVEKGLFAKYIPDILAKYRVHKKSMLRTITNKTAIERRKEIIERHPWINEFNKG